MGRRVLHLGPSSEGTELLATTDAQLVLAEDSSRGTISPSDVHCEEHLLPFSSASIDVVLAPGAARDGVDVMPLLLDEAKRILTAEGFIALILEAPEKRERSHDHDLDYWTLRELLEDRFQKVALLAIAPAKAFYVSYLEPERVAERLTLHDELLGDDPIATHFLAIAGKEKIPRLDPYHLVSLPPTETKPSWIETRLAAVQQAGEGARRELEDKQKEIAQLHERIERAEHAVTEVALERDRLASENRRIKATVARREEERLALRAQSEALARATERAERQEEAFARKLKREQLKSAEVERALASLEARYVSLSRTRDQLREALLAEEERSHEEARERARADQRASAYAKEIEALEALRERHIALEEEISSQRNELVRREAATEVLAEELRGLHDERRDLFATLREQRQARAEAEEALARAREHGDEIHRELRKKVEDLKEELSLARRQREDLEASLAELHARERRWREENETYLSELEATQRALRVAEESMFQLESAVSVERRDLFHALRERDAQRAKTEKLKRNLDQAVREKRAILQQIEEMKERQRALIRDLSGERAREAATYELEIDIRAQEMAHALATLEALEGELWKVRDAATRHAARVAAAAASADDAREKQQGSATQVKNLEESLAQLHERYVAISKEKSLREAQLEEALWDRERARGIAWRRRGAATKITSLRVALDRMRKERSSLEAKLEETLWDRERARGIAYRHEQEKAKANKARREVEARLAEAKATEKELKIALEELGGP